MLEEVVAGVAEDVVIDEVDEAVMSFAPCTAVFVEACPALPFM